MEFQYENNEKKFSLNTSVRFLVTTFTISSIILTLFTQTN